MWPSWNRQLNDTIDTIHPTLTHPAWWSFSPSNIAIYVVVQEKEYAGESLAHLTTAHEGINSQAGLSDYRF